MHVVRHHNDREQINFQTMIMKAMVENDSSDGFRQDPFLMRTEGDEIRLAFPLQVRKMASKNIGILLCLWISGSHVHLFYRKFDMVAQMLLCGADNVAQTVMCGADNVAQTLLSAKSIIAG